MALEDSAWISWKDPLEVKRYLLAKQQSFTFKAIGPQPVQWSNGHGLGSKFEAVDLGGHGPEMLMQKGTASGLCGWMSQIMARNLGERAT